MNKFGLIGLTLICFSIVFSVNRNSVFFERPTVLIPPPEKLELMSFGYSEVLSDSLWIRVIQNFDACGQSGVAEVLDYSKGVNLNQIPVCNFSWVYRMIDSVTDLSPRFYTAYYFGGMNLSYLVNDILGAQSIYEKGLSHFPNDLRILFSAAYHTLEQVKDQAKAAQLLLQAAAAGAPSFFMDLAAKLYSRGGRLEYAQDQLKRYIDNLPDTDPFRKRLEARLKLIQDEISSLNPKIKN